MNANVQSFVGGRVVLALAATTAALVAGVVPAQAVYTLSTQGTAAGDLTYTFGGDYFDRSRMQAKESMARATKDLVFAAIAAGDSTTAASLLEQEPALAFAVDASGRTPLHAAAEADDVRVARLLVDAGADVSAIDTQGRTPADCARARRSRGVARLLAGVDRKALYAKALTALVVAACALLVVGAGVLALAKLLPERRQGGDSPETSDETQGQGTGGP
jgi:hypothetical protein